jgi:hypothetical protein
MFQRDIWSQFIFNKELGDGTYGKVFLATSKESQLMMNNRATKLPQVEQHHQYAK